MSAIPGLDLLPVENSEGRSIQIFSFDDIVYRIPENHKDGKCRSNIEFIKISSLGDGTFGKIYKCKDKKDNNLVILKKYENLSDSESMLETLLNEVNILYNLKNINIVNLIEIVAGNKLDCFYTVEEHFAYTLAAFINDKWDTIFEPSVVKYIMRSLCNGLAYIHGCNVIHRNLNCQNITFNEAGVLKIANFENCQYLSAKICHPPLESSNRYAAPEILLGAKTYSSAIDMWSAGCILGELLQKKPLFNAGTSFEILEKIFYYLGVPNENTWPAFPKLPLSQKINIQGHSYSIIGKYFTSIGHSKSCCNFLKNLLVYCPEIRHKADECLEDSYFAEKPFADSVETMAVKLKNYNKMDTS